MRTLVELRRRGAALSGLLAACLLVGPVHASDSVALNPDVVLAAMPDDAPTAHFLSALEVEAELAAIFVEADAARAKLEETRHAVKLAEQVQMLAEHLGERLGALQRELSTGLADLNTRMALLEAAAGAGVRRFVHLSSDAAVGSRPRGGDPLDESATVPSLPSVVAGLVVADVVLQPRHGRETLEVGRELVHEAGVGRDRGLLVAERLGVIVVGGLFLGMLCHQQLMITARRAKGMDAFVQFGLGGERPPVVAVRLVHRDEPPRHHADKHQ